jgi:hypothetical protein
MFQRQVKSIRKTRETIKFSQEHYNGGRLGREGLLITARIRVNV